MTWLPVLSWFGFFNILFFFTWGHGPSSFLALLGIAGLVQGAIFGDSKFRSGNFPLALLLLGISIVISFWEFPNYSGYLGVHQDAPMVDIAENTLCAAKALFENRSNPYRSACQVHDVRTTPHASLDLDGQVRLFGLKYDNGYPYYPGMFFSYRPLSWLLEGRAAVRWTHVLLTIGTWILVLVLSREALPLGIIAIAASIASPRLWWEILGMGCTDAILPFFILLYLVFAKRQQWLLAGISLGWVVSCKLMPGALLSVYAFALAWKELDKSKKLRFFGGFFLVVAMVMLPFFLWDPERFISSTFLFYLSNHASGDNTALYFFLDESFQPIFTTLGLICVAIRTVQGCRKNTQTPDQMISHWVVTYLLFIAFSKMNHLNYILAIMPVAAYAFSRTFVFEESQKFKF